MDRPRIIIGLWCGGDPKEVTMEVHGIPAWKLTRERLLRVQASIYFLIPWDQSLDWLEHTIREGHRTIRRCSPDSLIAMRDLMAEHYGHADVGVRVLAQDVTIDAAEVDLMASVSEFTRETAVSRRDAGVLAKTAVGWIKDGYCKGFDEWAPYMSPKEARQFLPHHKPEEADARALWARQVRATEDPRS